jgi:predicted O-methyltransferase YrrM
MGWQIPPSQKFRQRPDINYDDFEFPKQRRIISVDPFPTRDARHLIDTSGLSGYVVFINKSSSEAGIKDKADLIFIDGDHSYEGCKRDVEHYIPCNLRPGGYFALHDYYGWYDELKQNKSPIKRVIDEIIESENFQHVLIDTGYMSFMIFRKPISTG